MEGLYNRLDTAQWIISKLEDKSEELFRMQ